VSGAWLTVAVVPSSGLEIPFCINPTHVQIPNLFGMLPGVPRKSQEQRRGESETPDLVSFFTGPTER